MKITIDKVNDCINEAEENADLAWYLEDNVYWSYAQPEEYDERQYPNIIINTEKDYICMPYETCTAFVWRGDKPLPVKYSGGGNYGCAMTFGNHCKGGYYTICMEND